MHIVFGRIDGIETSLLLQTTDMVLLLKALGESITGEQRAQTTVEELTRLLSDSNIQLKINMERVNSQ